jgi:hypothetical protein|tara:strand:+ start:2343 stop:3719 length:1377 start_codon:yes stop_codon:yes gene_type:complete
MTTRNFRVNNGLSVGDVVVNASNNKITGLSTSAPSADGDAATKKYVDDSISAADTYLELNDTPSSYTAKAIQAANAAGNATVNSELLVSASSNDVTVENGTSNKDIIFAVNDGGSATTEVFRLDGDVSALKVASGKQIQIGAAEENISGDGTDITFAVGSGGDINLPSNIGLTFGDDGEKIEGDGTNLTISSSGTLTISNTGLMTVSGSLKVAGDLTVDGTQTILNTTTLSVEDNIIEVNRNVSSNAGTPSVSGLQVNRGDGSTATEKALLWAWDESFADDGTTTFGNVGGAFTAFARARSDSGIPTADDLVDIRANVVHATSTSAQYADVAERFAADAPMAEGAVVMLGGTQEITETSTDKSPKVFGVISTQPAYAMNAGAGNNESHPYVAMTGRTPVRVTGSVNKGDRLVSSSIKGTARAVSDSEDINPFHVIGRALENKTDDSIGMVNCVVRTNN